jgi:hypothetical protein
MRKLRKTERSLRIGRESEEEKVKNDGGRSGAGTRMTKMRRLKTRNN